MTTTTSPSSASENRSRQLRNLIGEILLVVLIGWGTAILDAHGQAHSVAGTSSNQVSEGDPTAALDTAH